MANYFNIFNRAFTFIFSVLSIEVLGTFSILDIMGFGIVSMGIARLIILPVFGKFGGFGSSSAQRRRSNKSSEDD